MKEIFFHLPFLLLTLGPPLPTTLYGFTMLEIHGDVYIFGGRDSGYVYQSSIYQLSCSSELCSWSTLNQQLKLGRNYLVTIQVQDNFCTTTTTTTTTTATTTTSTTMTTTTTTTPTSTTTTNVMSSKRTLLEWLVYQ